MDLEAIKAWLEANKDNADVSAYMATLSKPNLESVKAFLNDGEGKRFMDAEKDKHSDKVLTTWKANNLDTLVDEEVKKRNPEKSPEMLKIEKLEKQLQDKEAAEKRQLLLTKAQQKAAESKLPLKFVDRLLGDDEDTTYANLDAFKAELDGYVQSEVDNKFKGNGGTPPKAGATGTGEQTPSIKSLAGELNLRNK